MDHESRNFGRIHFDCLVKFEFDDSRLDCELVDISLKGALLHNCTGATPKNDTPCKLIIFLSEDHAIKIEMKGVVAHKNSNKIGILCNHIDLDSMTHLKRLVEVNIGQPELLDRELSKLVN
ncbi:MAG: PilZ domain-containing protein [Gammaproteobacteria bacterium]|nr:PilZ domain-containing protein [Gammaproteobacteria bacterium]